jgi:hypothetical protein
MHTTVRTLFKRGMNKSEIARILGRQKNRKKHFKQN